MVELAKSIGLGVVHTAVVPLRARRPSTLLGQGQVATLGQAVADHSAELAVVDAALSPVQQRNLEREWRCKVIDRTGLILDIFGERARTREGAMQVELAHLQYQRSRLVRSWTHLGRQRGGFGFLGGPGETQIEADRRLIGDRIARLKRELEEVRRTRGLHREARKARAVPGGRAGGLHQRRQVHPVQRADRAPACSPRTSSSPRWTRRCAAPSCPPGAG
jgi:GTP-binding protein HflX